MPEWATEKRESNVEILLVMEAKTLPLSTLRALLELGYTPVRVADGAEALRAFSRQCFAAIVVDAERPEFRGAELVRYFRGQDAGLPIILIGAREPDYAEIAGLDHRCRVIPKPLDEVQLLTALVTLNAGVSRHPIVKDSRVSRPV
jgi:DNA-binding response OmpR family regulator